MTFAQAGDYVVAVSSITGITGQFVISVTDGTTRYAANASEHRPARQWDARQRPADHLRLSEVLLHHVVDFDS